MRKHSIFKLGLVLLIWGLIVLAGCSDIEETSKIKENEKSNEESNVVDDREQEKEGESNFKESNSITEGLFKDYQEKGEVCKAVEDKIERGDCFQTTHSNQLNWYMDESKDTFYYPFQREQDHFKEIIYLEINDLDELGEVLKAETYKDFLDKGNSEEDIKLGAELLEEYWYIFSNIIPKEYRLDLEFVSLLDTGEDYFIGIGRNSKNVQKMEFILSPNFGSYRSVYKYTLIHEFGHVLTLNEGQVKTDADLFLSEDEAVWEAAEAECPTYFDAWGCMEESSYLNQYYQLFWKDIYHEHKEIDWETEDDYKNFFFTYEDRFFNSYQGTSPAEDIAEAFATFVMMNSNDLEGKTEMKYEKLEFFYKYDELVELRTMILENIYDLVISDQKYY